MTTIPSCLHSEVSLDTNSLHVDISTHGEAAIISAVAVSILGDDAPQNDETEIMIECHLVIVIGLLMGLVRLQQEHLAGVGQTDRVQHSTAVQHWVGYR